MAQGRQLVVSTLVAGTIATLSPLCFAQGSETDAQEEPSEEALATARLHFKNGVDLLQGNPPNYQDAYRQFELALEKSGRSWKVLGNLGLCALKLERDGEALEFYGEYLKKGGDEVDPAERKHIEQELLLLKGNLTTVRIESSDPNARISVKRQGSHAPTQLYSLNEGKAELGLRSGSLVIVARSGDKVLEWNPVLSAGEEASHVFDFDAQEAPAAAATAQSAPAAATSDVAADSSSGPSGLRIAGFVTAGVGLATVAGGAVMGALSQSKASNAEDDCVARPVGAGTVCPESTESDIDSAKSMATAANIMFIGGGVLTAAGVTLVILGGNNSDESDPSTALLRLTPAPTRGGAGLFASGHF